MFDAVFCLDLFFAVLVFVYGALFGSFLNVVIYRMPLERSIVYPGSACGTCGTPLRWWENLPILSYFIQQGRCTTCGSVFSFRYAAVEALTAVLSVFLFYHYGELGWDFLYAFIFICYLIVVFFMDLDHWIILDSVSFSGAMVGLIGAFFVMPRTDTVIVCECMSSWGAQSLLASLSPQILNIISSLVGIALGGLFFWAIQFFGALLAKKDALGSGDIKYAMLLGAFLGFQYGLIAFFLSFIIGAFTALFLMCFSKKRAKDPVPLGTFMSIASFVTLIWGEEIYNFILFWPTYFQY